MSAVEFSCRLYCKIRQTLAERRAKHPIHFSTRISANQSDLQAIISVGYVIESVCLSISQSVGRSVTRSEWSSRHGQHSVCWTINSSELFSSCKKLYRTTVKHFHIAIE